ncbi:penicillin acylase family protein [Pelagovum pacificum]|uniref:Penicillin acylase family protein n=1 Tax=Pelagovum pacificum TaxID=2588711 RepID=A0A5C5GC46_9RHOB|nr:penicillin acylase family protein [Pelagovum pacificum]QQA44672.1 penicillin acylase family protein [Pelagovum pacificum]TNY32218.1 penicillin acylase family protein [Pelagovum pacificum]
MVFAFRWLLRIATGLFVFGVAAFALAYYFASRSLPDYDGTYEVAGIDAPVEIVRDNSNVPHIFGATDPDVFYALGYAHAQDRLWQMTILRRTAQGRLSELFGERTLQTDTLLRRLDLYNLSVRSVQVQDAATRSALEAYADGVNAWLGQVNEGARGRGAPEMWLFSHPIAPWQPADSIAIVKLMALQLSGHLRQEVLRARASRLLEDDWLEDLMPNAPGRGIAALPRYGALFPDSPRYAASDPEITDPYYPVPPADFAGASNAWAAGISRSATGSTLLANDPHLGLSAPSIFYLARLELQSGGVIGATIPGVPLVLSGRSADLGWGITSAYLDDADLHMEEVNPADATEYRTPDGWAEFETRDSIVLVKDGPARTLRLSWTENGPVLPPDQFDLSAIRPPGHVTTLNWTALSDADTTMSAGIALMRAHNIEEALEASHQFVAPAQMLTVADRNRIAMRLIGAMPRRDPGHQSLGRLPTPGYVAENRWQGMFPPEENPEWIEPEGGILGHTNNKILNAPFPRHVSYWWGDSQRVQRWRRLMQSREVHTRESFMEAQLDTVSYTAQSLLALIGADLWYTGESAPEGTPERQRQIALQLLADWNGEMNEHLPEPLIYAAWLRALQDRLIRDELGPLAEEYIHVEPLFIERVFRDIGGASRWCDVQQSAPVESCTDISRQALDDALVWIGETYGDDLQTLRWGDAHQAKHDHQALGSLAVLRWFVNIRQSTSGGDFTLMRGQTSGIGDEPFSNVHAAVYRGIYDFADPDSSVFVTSTGQSGHPLSRYYDDLGELWRRGEYIPMSLDPALARGGAVGITELLPETPAD